MSVDGLKLVMAVVISNPSISKSEKQVMVGRVNKLFEDGVAAKLYSPAVSEAFKGFNAAGQADTKPLNKASTNRFWKRK